MAKKRVALAIVLAISGAGCSGLPNAGPRASEVFSQADSAEAHRMGIVMVELTQDVCDSLKLRRPASLSGTFGEGAPAVPVINIGDVLSVSIWEAGSGSLFSTPAVPGQALQTSRGAVLPNMAVQPDGMITIPYAGRVAVAGLEPAAVENAITARLHGKAVDPQVLVTVASSTGNSVTIGGGASGGARVPLSVKGDRVLDVIAAAGGLHIPLDDAVIYLTRGDHTAAIAYDDILDNPAENIFLKSGDLLTVASRPPSFLALGAVQRTGQIAFDAHAVNLAEAVAKSAGLSDSRADPEGLFLFRYETADIARKIAPGRVPDGTDAPVPVIYHLNLRDASQFFLARQFMVQDKDMIYVAGAPLNDLQKFFDVIGAVLAPAANAVGVGAAATTLGRMIPAIAYDLTRLLLGPALPVPRGIDRVDLGYARYFLESWQGECVGILPLPLGLFGGVLVIERGAALGLLNLIADIWGETGMPDGDPALAHIKARLADPLSDLAQPNPPYHFRPHRIVLSFLKALFRMGLRGLRLRRSIARGAIYVNTGQLGLAFPWATAWLNRRPDVRRVHMLHDVIPLEYPELVTPSGTRLHVRMIENTARHADGLIVTTEAVRHAVRHELAKCNRHDIPTMAAPLPVASLFLAAEPIDTGLSGSRYFVIVGSIEPRKNHSLLVDVWTRLVAKDARAPKLVIVGTPWRDAENVIGPIALSDRLRQAVIMVTGLTSPALCRLIRGAEGLLVPSFSEGFGLPIVEALALGTPVIASDLPAHREAGGGFVTYLDPRDADAWEAAIGAQLQEPQAHRARLKSYSPWDWNNYAACLAPFLIGMA